jgi:hypothetical protein
VVIASDQSAIRTVEPALIITGAPSQTAIVNNILENPAGAVGTDVTNYRSMTVQVVCSGTGGAFIFEQSNDGINWRALPVYNSELTTGVPIVAAITATASSIIYTVPLRARFIRLRISAPITGGSASTFSRISTEPWTPTVATVAQPVGASLQTSATLAAGISLAADVGIQYRATATGAASAVKVISAATTNPNLVKGAAGRVVGYDLINNATAVRYVKLFSKATAPVPGTDIPIAIISIGANGGKAQASIPGGLGFALGIGYSIVAGSADLDTTAIASGDVVGTILFA